MYTIEDLLDNCSGCLRFAVRLSPIILDEDSEEYEQDSQGFIFAYPGIVGDAPVTRPLSQNLPIANESDFDFEDGLGGASVLLSKFNYSSSAYSGEGPQAGPSPESYGNITIDNGCGSYDRITRYVWDGRPVEVLAGLPGWSLNEFVPVFRGSSQKLTWNVKQIDVILRSRGSFLDARINRKRYTGAGGYDGALSLKGQYSPVAFGYVFNAKPTLIDPANLIYQVHDSSIQAVTVVRDRGVPLLNSGDHSNLYSAVIPDGYFGTDLANGLFKLGAPPDGRVTCDIEGENTGGFVSTTADIVQRILKTRLYYNSLDDADLDLASFSDFNTRFGYDIGFYSDKETRIDKIISDLVLGANGFWGYTRDGLFQVGLVRKPDTLDHELTESDIVSPYDGSGFFKQVGTQPPSFRREVFYRKNYSTLSDSDIAYSVGETDRVGLSQEYSSVWATNPTTQTLYPSALDKSLNTFIRNEADATEFAHELLDFYGVKRDRYQFKVDCGLFRFEKGQSCSLDISRYVQDKNRLFYIESVSEKQSDLAAELKVLG